MVIFHEYADNLSHLMNRMGLISAGAEVVYAFATRNLVYNGRQYFSGLYNWDNRNIMLGNLGNYRMAILGTRYNRQIMNANPAKLRVFNHYLAVFRWKDPEQDNRISLLFYDPEPSISPTVHHYLTTLAEEGYTRVQLLGTICKENRRIHQLSHDDEARVEYNCSARCIAFLLTVLHHGTKAFEHPKYRE